MAATRERRSMNRRQLIVGLGAALSVSLGLLFGGVFSSEQPRPDAQAFAPAKAAIPGVADGNDALAKLLEGFSTGDTAAFARTLEQASRKTRGSRRSHAARPHLPAARPGDGRSHLLQPFGAGASTGRSSSGPIQPLATTGLASLAVARHRFNDALVLARRAIGQNQRTRAPTGPSATPCSRSVATRRRSTRTTAWRFSRRASPSYSRVAHARQLPGVRPRQSQRSRRPELRSPCPSTSPGCECSSATSFSRQAASEGRGFLRAALEGFRATSMRRPVWPRSKRHRADTIPRSRGCGRSSTVFPTPGYAILLGDVLTAAGRTAEADDAYELVDAIEDSFPPTGSGTSSRPRSSISTTIGI